MHCASVSAVLITSVFYSLVKSERLSNTLRFLFLLDNLCYSCTCLAPPRLAFQLFSGQTMQLLYLCTKNKVVVVVHQYNCSLRTCRIFAIICSSEFDVYV